MSGTTDALSCSPGFAPTDGTAVDTSVGAAVGSGDATAVTAAATAEVAADAKLEDMVATKVLIVDDEPAVRDALRRSLAFEGYETALAVDGLEALEKTASYEPDLILLDVLMPRMDGLTAARRLRAAGQRVPILMLTARDTVGDRVTGLDAGADDYLVKPFELDELLARIRALLRRTSYAQEQAGAIADVDFGSGARGFLTFGDLRMDLATREVTRRGRTVELTRTEYTLLEMFLSHPRQVLTREQILKSVWGFDFEPSSNSLDVYVMYLRRKTEAGGEPRLLHTVRGVGYVLKDDGA
jgi:two-component system, OmpR family, response regulator MprA